MSTLMKYKYWIGGAFSLFVLALIIGAIRPKGVSGAPTAPPAEVQENIIVRGKTSTRYGMFREDVLQCDGTFKRVQRCVLSLAARVQQPSELTLDAATHILRTIYIIATSLPEMTDLGATNGAKSTVTKHLNRIPFLCVTRKFV